MKIVIACFVLVFALCMKLTAQDTATCGQVVVWSEQGWMMKAVNLGATPVYLKFNWNTVGFNGAGEIANTVSDESQRMTLNPGETRQLFTSPQDPTKKLTYVFRDINITECRAWTMQDEIERKMNAKKASGQ